MRESRAIHRETKRCPKWPRGILCQGSTRIAVTHYPDAKDVPKRTRLPQPSKTTQHVLSRGLLLREMQGPLFLASRSPSILLPIPKKGQFGQDLFSVTLLTRRIHQVTYTHHMAVPEAPQAALPSQQTACAKQGFRATT